MEYWIEKLKDSNEIIDYWNRNVVKLDENSWYEKAFYLRDDLKEKLLTISNNRENALYMVFLCATAILNRIYSIDNNPFIISCHPMHCSIGMANMLPLCGKVNDEANIIEMLNDIKNNYKELNDNKAININAVRKIFYDKFGAKASYINTGVILESMMDNLGESNLYGEELLFYIEIKENICVKLKGIKSKYSEASIIRIWSHMEAVLKGIVGNPTQKISEIDILTEEEKNKLLYEYNNTAHRYSDDKTMIDIWEDTIYKYDKHTAVIFGNQSLSYEELDRRSTRLALYLRKNGVKRNSIVGIMVERSFEMMIGIWGIVKAGGAYMPMLPSYPNARIKYMTEDSGAGIILSVSKFQSQIPDNVKYIDIEKMSYGEADIEKLEKINSPEDLLYVIYTSGSTGNPKGVMTKHTAYINRIEWMLRKYGINEFDTMLQKTSYCFDVSVYELLMMSFVGGSVSMLGQGDEAIPERILNEILKNHVTIVHFVPSMLNTYMQWIDRHQNRILEMGSVRYVMCSGEALSAASVNHFHSKIANQLNCNIIDLYGPTEAAIEVSYFDCERDKKYNFIPIGKPIDNIKLLILNKQQKMVPAGVAGELYIGGVGVAAGYLNNEELTAERFVENDYVEGKLYRTGDLVRWLDDGNIEYISRIDNQVKVRGFRIELGEIETRLLEYPSVDQAVVLVKKVNEEDYICAYFASNENVCFEELKKYIGIKLPSYMIPNYFIRVDKIPVTNNGKADRRKLLEIEILNQTNNEYVEPENDAERKMAAIFCEILNLNTISVIDSFFDRGGHSLKATELMSRIYDEFQVSMPIMDIFQYQSVRNLVKHLPENKDQDNIFYRTISRVGDKNYYDTSAAQKRVYMQQQMNLENIAYNLPACFIVKGTLEYEKVKHAFHSLINRHESLRTSFQVINSEIVQKINDRCDFHVGYLEADDSEIEKKFIDFIKPFKLEQAPLFRASICKTADDSYAVFIDMHHIIGDGVSINILVNEFMKLYTGLHLEELKLTYKDYAEWSNLLRSSDVMLIERKYWKDKYADEIQPLNLRTDFPRKPGKIYKGGIKRYHLKPAIAAELDKIGKEYGTTLYITLLSGLNILLSKYTGQKDIIVGCPVAGRRNSGLQGIVGMFVNTLAIKSSIVSNERYDDYLSRLAKEVIKDFENQDFQYDDLINELNIEREYGRNPLFDVMFSVQKWYENEFEITGLKLHQMERTESNVKFELNIVAMQEQAGITVEFEYALELYKQETIDRLWEHFERILEQITQTHNICIADIECNLDSEKVFILQNNQTDAAIPEKNIIDLFEEQVKRTPLSIAVTKDREYLTYKELNDKAEIVAALLKERGVKQGDNVVILCQRSIEMIIGILGTLKIGAAYVPVDANYLTNRINFILNDCDAKAVIVYKVKELVKELIGENRQVMDLETLSCSVVNSINTATKSDGNTPFYVIYTSGTTGNPKGAIIRNRSFVNLVYWYINEFELSCEDVVIFMASISFDLAQKNIFAPLLCGAKLCIYDIAELNYNTLADVIYNQKVTWLNCAPSAFYPLVQEDEKNAFHRLVSIKKVFLGGESINYDKLHPWLKTDTEVEIINTYGPTECTDVVAYYRCNFNETKKNYLIPIGKPLPNTQLYIVQNQKLCGIGVPGELCIAGIGVSNGYINNHKLTEERFVQNLFGEGKMYRTGDITYLQPDGNIAFVGRMDDQVKIHGIRIELGEIENAIRRQDGIVDCVIIVRTIASVKRLVAYVVAKYDIDGKELRNLLRKEIQDYMIPSYFVQIDVIPITGNGKLDKRALPDVDTSLDTVIIKPADKKEEAIAKIYEKVFRTEKVSVTDTFFEMGGDSLKAIQLATLLKNVGIDISIAELMSGMTIRKLAPMIKQEDSSGNTDLVTGFCKLTPIMKWFLNCDCKEPNFYNQSVMLMTKQIDIDTLKSALYDVICHHDMLRAVYRYGQLYVRDLCDERLFELYEYHLEEETAEIAGAIIESESRKIQGNINITEGPFVHTAAFYVRDCVHLLLVIHHLVIDLVSLGIILEDIYKSYTARLKGMKALLPPKGCSYIEWAYALEEYALSDKLTSQEQYWNSVLSDVDEAIIEGNRSGERNEVMTEMALSYEMTDCLLNEIRNKYKAEVNEIVIAVIGMAVYTLTGKDKLAIILEGHGRQQIHKSLDIYRSVGWFTSIYPFIIQTGDDITENIYKNQANLEQVPDNGYGYLVLKYNKPGALIDKNINFWFNYRGAMSDRISNETESLADNHFRPSIYSTGSNKSKDNDMSYLISIDCFIRDKKMCFEIAYDLGQISETFISDLKEQIAFSIAKIINHTLSKEGDFEDEYYSMHKSC